jgi:hypothetical protein
MISVNLLLPSLFLLAAFMAVIAFARCWVPCALQQMQLCFGMIETTWAFGPGRVFLVWVEFRRVSANRLQIVDKLHVLDSFGAGQ